MNSSSLAALAACLVSVLLASGHARADGKLAPMRLLPIPCYQGAPVNRATGAPSPSTHAVEAAVADKRATEQLALEVQYQGGKWPPVLSAAQRAFQAAVAAFGPGDVCIVPFLEELGASAAAMSDLRTAEAEYRRSLGLLSNPPVATFYRATLAENLARLLTEEGRDSEAAAAQTLSNRLRGAASAVDPSEDVYCVRQSSIDAGSVFLGPTTGAQELNDMALPYGIYNDPFRFQLYELHAQYCLHEAHNPYSRAAARVA